MPLYPILHRFSATPIVLIEASDFRRALVACKIRNVSLKYADLRGVVVPGTDLDGICFDRADFTSAILNGCCFDGCSLEGAKFVHAHLSECSFLGATLDNANFMCADLSLENLGGPHKNLRLDGAILYRTSLVRAENSLETPEARCNEQKRKLWM